MNLFIFSDVDLSCCYAEWNFLDILLVHASLLYIYLGIELLCQKVSMYSLHFIIGFTKWFNQYSNNISGLDLQNGFLKDYIFLLGIVQAFYEFKSQLQQFSIVLCVLPQDCCFLLITHYFSFFSPVIILLFHFLN